MRFVLAFALAVGSLFAAGKEDLSEQQIQDIIQKFAAKETEFARARENYIYRQTARIFEYDQSGTPGGKFEVTSDITFSGDGKRTERIVKAPVPTLRLIGLTPEDEQDLRAVQPFVLTSKDIDKYAVRYLGHEQVDEIPCFVFAVKPKKMEAGQRYFSGIVWVDDRDLQIVKSYGRGTGLAKKNFDNKFPKFETFREQIDGKFWFPTYTSANDTLFFDDGQIVKIRMNVRYEDYKQFKADTKITFGEPVTNDGKPAEPPKEKK
ncbi:MAG: hypothetical protein IT168_06685 [Bryobacterales bacterium]|nr:hypothetical protein [Bryobacterales bacterium]